MDVLGWLTGDSRQDRFARRVAKRLKASGWTGPAPRYDRASFSLNVGDGSIMRLARGHDQWLGLPARQKDRQIDLMVASLLESRRELTWASSAARLVPLLRNRASLSGEQGKMFSDAGRPFCEDLLLTLGVDQDHGTAHVSDHLLNDWGTTFDEALDLAFGNFAAMEPSGFIRSHEGYWITTLGGVYNASQMLLPDRLLQLEMNGPPVAIPLNRETLVFAGADDVDGLEAMAAFVEQQYPKSDHAIGCAAMAYRDGRWAPAADQPDAAWPLQRLAVLQRFYDYANQKAELDWTLPASGGDAYVARLGTVGAERELRTIAVWPSHTDVFLPKAHIVSFARGRADQDFEHRHRLWTDVEGAFGPLTPVPNLYPPRYRLQRWPVGLWERVEALPVAPGFTS